MIIALLLGAGPEIAFTEMHMMDEIELSGVSAQAGIMIISDIQVNVSYDTINFSDSGTGTEQDWIELTGVTVHDSAGGPFTIQSPVETPSAIDIATDADGWSYLSILDSSCIQPRYYTIDRIVFCEQAIGGLEIGHVVRQPSTLRLGAHGDDTTGVDWDYATQIDIDSFRYTYNDNEDAFYFDGFHLAGSAAGDPTDPTAWTFDGQFKVGDLDNDNPATFDIGTNASGETIMVMTLPMEGTLRIENIDFGGQAFGPAAIDGLQVHRLAVAFDPH
ncbi:MAG: hypothetical protein KQI81_23480 [Deltaproteobacteria bacterium]|nr:hypothetical protein [Deltaproteobacteria bacterium]